MKSGMRKESTEGWLWDEERIAHDVEEDNEKMLKKKDSWYKNQTGNNGSESKAKLGSFQDN